MKRGQTLRALLFAVAVAATHAAMANITSTSLEIQGSGLKVVTESVTTGIDLPVTVQTEFGGKQNDEAIALEGVVATGELTGPGIDTPIQLTTAPGHRFSIPGLSRTGVYHLQNVRLMNGTQFLQYATPAVAVITVADLLDTKVTVKQLSPAELRERGITVDARNFDVYDYTFTFTINGQEVKVTYPVIVDPRTHQVQPARGESPYVLPSPGLVQPPRWSPPTLIPMNFADEGELPQPGEEPKDRAQGAGHVSIPAAIVIPNSLAVLHQFFGVLVMVQNGAPEQSAAELHDIRATIRIPTALRTVQTDPQVSFGQAVPIVEPLTGRTFLIAQARGEADWTLEGLQPGTHRIDFDIRATLRQPGQADTSLRAAPSAAIVVHDPRFNINFSHPDTVRKGIEYSTYTFVTNMSATAQSVTITSGVEPCDVNPAANVCRLDGGVTDLLQIPAGDMRLIEYRLRSGVTGQVFATAGTLSSTDNLTASVRLHMGVSESGIPLSPATLILPHYAQFVSPDVVSANLQLLGLGYSLATAPLNQVTARFPRVIKTDVFQRAIDVARAGQRIFIAGGAPAAKRDSIAHLALDLLGNGGYELREWDELRRREKSGRTAGAAVVRELEATGLSGTATMTSFFDDVASATAHRQPFVAALAHGAATGERPYAISIQGRTTGRRADVPNEAAEGWLRELPFSDISRFSGSGETGELALLGRWTEDVDLVVTPAQDGPFVLDVVYPNTLDGSVQRARFDISGTRGKKVTVTLTRGAGSLNAMADGGVTSVGTVTTVHPAPLSIVAARQDLFLDPDGHKVSILFNRPIEIPAGVDLRTKFSGAIDFNRDGVVYKGSRPISAAALQDDGRTVNVTFDHALSQNATYTLETGTLQDPITGQTVSFASNTVPRIDNDLPAGILYGKVVRGDGTPVAGVDVVLRQYEPGRLSSEPTGTPQYDVSQSDGAFLFEFVRRQTDVGWSGAYRLQGVSSVHGTTTLDGSVRSPGNVHHVSLQYLGRGSAEGYVRYDNGEVVAGATVVIGSTMFNQFRNSTTDTEGFYRIEDLPVGPLTFSARDAAGNVAYAAAEIATPGQRINQNLSIYRAPFPGVGRVHGTVRRSDTSEALAGIHVAVFSQGFGLVDGYTDSSGRFEFEKVPAGFITVLAEEWSFARQSVAADYDLQPNEVKQADLLFLIAPDLKTTKLTGFVKRENPLQPGVHENVPGALVKIAGYRIVTADADGQFVYEDLPLAFSNKTITAYDPATQRTKTMLFSLTEAGPNNVGIFINAFDRGTGTIRVRLLNAGGAPVSNYRVIVPGLPPKALSGKGDGIYELEDVPVGIAFGIRAVPSGVRPATGPDSRAYGDQMAEGHGSVAFNGHIAALTLRLPGEGTVRVKVRSQFDLITPVGLSYLVWDEGEQRTTILGLEESTSKNGEPDWAVFTRVPALGSGFKVVSAHPQYGQAEARGTLAFDGDLQDHVLQLNTLSTIRGTVYAIDGVTPVAGASVTVANGRSDPGPQLTGPDGRFAFSDQPSDVNATITAQVTQSGIYRIGAATVSTPAKGGVVENVSVVLRKRGFVDGFVVYKSYKRFDPDNVANNIPDDTPDDYSDNAPVPLAKFHLRELDFPNRSFGTPAEPRTADVTGRFVINNVFTGSLRATAWDSGNEELRGDWIGRIDEEGQEATPRAYIAVGDGGVGALTVRVVDPNQSYAEVANADVSVMRGPQLFDVSTTGSTGSAQFDDVPAGTYSVSAYSKALGKSSSSESVGVTRDGATSVRLELEFSGTVDGTLTDPEIGNAPVPGSDVRLTAAAYAAQASTGADGAFTFLGVREGSFRLDAKDTDTNRRASASRTLSVLDPHQTVNLQLEPTETLHFAAYLPDDTGGRSNVLAPATRVEVLQDCWDGGGVRSCEYARELHGNLLQFPGVFENRPYRIDVWEPGVDSARIRLYGGFPKGSAADPYVYVYPAFGEVHVTVTQDGAPAAGAKATIHHNGPSQTVYTDSAGLAIARGIRLGEVNVHVESLDGRFNGTASATLARQSVPATVTIALGSYAGVTGYVEAEAGGPSVGTRVHATHGSIVGEIRTDPNGRYTFLGIPTSGAGATRVNLTFIGPDDTTIGGATFKDVRAGDGVVEVGAVKIDATPPQLETILPTDGAVDVSPDTNVIVTFSEPIDPSSVNGSNFQLIAADGSGAVACALTSQQLADGRFAVTMKPVPAVSGFPLRSNTLHRVIVAQSVRDTTGHALPAARGFTFTTSDYAEPRVLKVLPASPIPAATTFEFRFNEPIDPTPWQTGGSGVFRIEKLAAPGGVGAAIERTLASRAFVDPTTNMTLFIAPGDQNPILPESFYRVVFSGVRDPQGNVLAEQTYRFYSFDQIAPHVVFVAPSASEQLVSGAEYEIRIDVRNGSASGTPATDVSKVEYFTVAADGRETPFATVTQAPYSTKVLGPEAPVGGTTFTIGAQGYDASGNQGPKSTATWTVKPNAPPFDVTVTPLQPSAYPSAQIGGLVTFADEGSFATITMSFRIPKSGGTNETKNITQSYTRLANGTWPEARFVHTLPADAKAGEIVTLTATVVDVRGLTSAPATAEVRIEADLVQPSIISVTPSPGTTFSNGDKFEVEAIVSDAETGVQNVTFFVDGEPYAVAASGAGPTPGTQKFRSVTIEARASAVDAEIPLSVTAKDWNGNTRTKTHNILYKGVNDPDAPSVSWLCPIDRAALPALRANVPLTLRVNVVDEDVRAVQFVIGTEGTTVTGVLVSGTRYEATYVFAQTPPAGPLPIRVIVDDTVPAHRVELPITIDVVDVDFVFTDPKPITAADAASFADKTVAVIGAGAVLAPQVPVTMRNLLVLDGARVETLPADFDREFRLDITTTGTTYVDCASRIDVSEKGYAGGHRPVTGQSNPEPRGRTIGNTAIGGARDSASHAGVGGTWDDTRTNAVYGSIFHPTDLGSGGGGAMDGTFPVPGGSGGGAIRLRGGSSEDDSSRILIAGQVKADGGQGLPPNLAPGSGGSIWIEAKHVVFGSAAHVSANGGDEDGTGVGSAGAGGGRLSLAGSMKLDIQNATVEARGGRNTNTAEARYGLDGGAGTIYVRRPGQEQGELIVNALDPRYPDTGHLTRHTPLGRIGRGTSSAVTASTLTDASRIFDRAVVGESLVIGDATSQRFRVTGLSSDGRTLHTEPLDGSLLSVAGSQTVSYTGMLAFDRVTAAKRSLLDFDDHVAVSGTVDDKASMTIDATAVVVLRDEQPALTMTTTPAAGAMLARESTLSATYSVASAAGLSKVTLEWSLDPTLRVDTYQGYPLATAAKTVVLVVPSTAPLGPATLKISALDRSGHTHQLSSLAFTIMENSGPVVSGLSVMPSSTHAGRDVVATATVSDDIAVKSLSFDARLNGTSIKTVSFTPNTAQTTQQFTVSIPPATAGGSTLTIDVSASDGFAGRPPTVASQSVTILQDTVGPQITVLSPAANTSYRESIDKVPVRVSTVDAEVAVKEVLARFDGGQPISLSRVGTTNEWSAEVPAPSVDGTADVQRVLTVTSVDFAGNATESQPVAVTIKPVDDASAPVLSMVCSSPDAMFPVGTTVIVRVSAAPGTTTEGSQSAVQSVEMVLNDDTRLTVASAGTNLFEASYVIPAATADGAVFRVRVLARSAGGATSDLLTSFIAVVPDVTIAANTTIEAANSAYENKTVVVQAGTLTIAGAHLFDRLVVLGGNVTHASGGLLQIHAVRGAYIGCGGSIDATGRGYGANATYPGATTPGHESAGSHLGYGGLGGAPRASTFGSIYRPMEAGGGGNRLDFGGAGGGVVRVTGATLVNDGLIRANGSATPDAGAGGSVFIDATTVRGGGRIEARGGDGHRSGGGGAVAVEYSSASGTVLSNNTVAAGGNTVVRGGPGTIYLKGPASTYGDLTIDNLGFSGPATVLPSIGRGHVIAVDGATITSDADTDFPAYFAGHWIDVFTAGGERKGTWRTSSVAGRTFTLESNGDVLPSVNAGDRWRGVYLIDKLTLKSATLMVLDDIRSASQVVDASSSLIINDPPAFDTSRLSAIVAETRPDGDFVSAPEGMVSDLHPPVVISVKNTRSGQFFTANALSDGSFRISVQGQPGDTFTLRATDSFSLPATTASVPVNGSLSNGNGVAFLALQSSTTTGGSRVTGTLRMLHPVTKASDGIVALTSSSPAASVPSTVTVPVGASSASFDVVTTNVAADANVLITASAGLGSQSATLTLLAGTSALAQLVLDTPAVEGGTSINGTLILGAPAPSGGAAVAVTSSDTRLATVPPVVVVPAGATSVAFTVTTYGVPATSAVGLTAVYGASASATATLSACTELGVAPPPASVSLGTTWFDDTPPAGATQSGDAVIDSTQFASGTSAIHLSGATAGVRTFAFTGAAALSVGPNDVLVVHALVNPCNPPRQVLIAWKGGTAEYRSSWGESRIDPTTPHRSAGSVPRSGEWMRLAVLARSLGITADVSLTDLSIRTVDGEAWFDAIGTSSCTLPAAPAPQINPHEMVWFDDELPEGAKEDPEISTRKFFQWDTTQAASGARSHRESLQSGLHEHAFYDATETMSMAQGDVLFTYVYLDPCNPPRQVMLNWFDGASWEHRAYWGDNLVTWGSDGRASRYRMGPLPETGKWVRLEVPAALVDMQNRTATGAAYVLYDGQAWFDRAGKISRVNVAVGKPARQSTTFETATADLAVDGNAAGVWETSSATAYQARPWWEVDLGAVFPIDTIAIYGRTDCCLSQTTEIYILVSDVPFVSEILETTLAQPGVSAYTFPGTVGTLHEATIRRTGRHVRVHMARTDHLTMREVQVWMPVTASRVNVAGGRAATSSTIFNGWTSAHHAMNGDRNSTVNDRGSLFASATEAQPWWEVDLGAVIPLSTVDLWSRVDCCPEQTSALYLFVSDVPFTSKALNETLMQAGVAAHYLHTSTRPVVSFPVDRTGRYLRVQKTDTANLAFTEIEVWSQQPGLPAMSRPQESPPHR